jgi:hypothetical protein
MTLDERIKWWIDTADRVKGDPIFAMACWGISCGLQIAKNEHGAHDLKTKERPVVEPASV